MLRLLKAVKGFLVVLGVLPVVKPPRTGAGGLLVASVVIAVSAGSSLPTPGWTELWLMQCDGRPVSPVRPGEQRANFSGGTWGPVRSGWTQSPSDESPEHAGL